jgi:hypothetical protein
MKTKYNPDKGEAAAALWNRLAYHEGEDADAQIIIEKALDDYTNAQFAALAELTDAEGKYGFRIVLEYDNTHDGARVLNADGKVIGECYDGRMKPNAQFVRAIKAALAGEGNHEPNA